MWVPKTEDEINSVIASKKLEESNTFDAKQELPKTAEELAKDVAAMATDGGVLIYGIGEDTNKRPTVLTPILLSGAKERVDAIIRSNIQEPPVVVITSIPTAADSSLGYLVVLVPPSPRAPHMVTYRGDNRFYGRGPTGNIALTEGEVARLYERRQRWEIDRNALLNQEIANTQIDPHPDYSYLHIFVRPVLTDENMLERGTQGYSAQDGLNEIFLDMLNAKVYPENFYPFLYTPQQWIRRSEGYLGIVNTMNDSDPQKYRSLINVQIDFDGSSHLFCARSGEREQSNGPFIFFPSVVAGNASRFFRLLGGLYEKASYIGLVDIGVAITNLRGIVPDPNYNLGYFLSLVNKPYDRDEYRKTLRISALELLNNPQKVGYTLLIPLIRAITQSNFNPFPAVNT